MIWSTGVDLLWGDGLSDAGISNLAGLVLFVTMALLSKPKFHAIGTGVAWLLFVVLLVAKGTGIAV
jgi:hypothetical protein